MRVVIVDDHAIVRDGLRLMLEHADDIDVVGEVAEGGALLDLLAEVETDIILLDMRMDGMNGLETLEMLGDSHPDILVVMLTMHDDASLLGRAIELGARGYVLKGSGRDVLVRALRTVSAGGAFVDPRLTEALVSIARLPEGTLLTDADLHILRLLATGASNRVIAEMTEMTASQLRSHLKDIYEALEASGRSEAVANALRRGLII